MMAFAVLSIFASFGVLLYIASLNFGAPWAPGGPEGSTGPHRVPRALAVGTIGGVLEGPLGAFRGRMNPGG